MFMFFSPVKGRTTPAKRLNAALFAAAVVFTLALGGCEDGDPAFVDDHQLNSTLVGTWIASGEYELEGTTYSWEDKYIIEDKNGNKILSHEENYGGSSIVYVYNFSETAGCIIIKRVTDNKFTAVYFKNLQGNSVLLGDAYDTSISYPDDNDPGVVSLDAAKEKFKPENAEAYGGGSKQEGTPQLRQGK